MSGKIDLGSLTNATFTSGDTIKGVLKLRFESAETVRNIQLKLEGVAFSRTPVIENQKDSRDSNKESFAIEIHKFLYLTQTVFPPRAVDQASTTHQFTLPAGEHQYPFSFKIPNNTDCELIKQPAPLSLSRFVIDNKSIDYARETSRHVRGPLPPALSDMSQIASVRYFLKATVNRTSFLRVNLRIYQPFIYISPDRIDPNVGMNEIRYARRQISLPMDRAAALAMQKQQQSQSQQQQQKGFFKSLFSSGQNASAAPSLNIMFDMRYPTYINPTQELPLRLFVIHLKDPRTTGSENAPTVYMDDLIIKLYAVTETRSQEYSKRHTHSITLMNQTNMRIALPGSEFAPATVPKLGQVWEAEIPSAIWEKVRIPDSVAPSFMTCNIIRSYSVEIVAGFSLRSSYSTNSQSSPIQYASVVGDITILSGIKKKDLSAPPPKPPRPAVPAGNVNVDPEAGIDAPPPSYNEVIQDELANPSDRRTFQQSSEYYSNLESLDTDRKH